VGFEGAAPGINLNEYPDLNVVSVNDIYEALVLRLLGEAQKRNGFKTWKEVKEEGDNFEMVKARPKACMPKPPDVHYR